MSELILRPDGLLHGRAARQAVLDNDAGWLAGGPVAFSRAGLLDGAAGATTSYNLTYSELSAVTDSSVATLLERMCAPRPAMAGLDWQRVRIMGIVNVTPDSFSDGGLYSSAQAAIAHGKALALAGADIVDIGGESTRPGAAPVPAADEWARIAPVLDELRGGVPVSVDSRKADVMRLAGAHGAMMINDVAALGFEPQAMQAARATQLPVVLMHAKGTPGDMQRAPEYEDVLGEVYAYLEQRITRCEQAGLPRSRLIVDPGIGFGKTLAHNLKLLASLGAFHGLGCPVLLGGSRKRFIGELSGEQAADKRLPGSLAAVFQAAAQGVQIVRVHDVAETRQGLDVAEAMMAA